MANADAFNSGFDLGTGKDKQKPAKPKQFKKGGKVKRTGTALVHKGEVVLTKAQAKKYKARKRVASKG